MLNLMLVTLTIISMLLMPIHAKGADQCTTPAALQRSNLPLKEFQKVCREIVNTDPGCLQIKDPSKRMSCDATKNSNEIWNRKDLSAKVFQCAKGFLWDSMKELGKFVVELIGLLVKTNVRSVKAMHKFMTKRAYRERLLSKTQSGSSKNVRLARAFLNSSALYFSQEFPKNLKKNPLNPLLALGETLAKPLVNLLTQSAEAIYEHFMPQFQCLNGPAKVHAICKIGGEIFMPPAILLTFLKKGIAGLRAAHKVKIGRATQRFQRFAQTGGSRSMGAEDLASSIHLTQVHRVRKPRRSMSEGPRPLTPARLAEDRKVLSEIIDDAREIGEELKDLRDKLSSTKRSSKQGQLLQREIDALEEELAGLDAEFISTAQSSFRDAGVPTRLLREGNRTRLIIEVSAPATENSAFNFYRRAQRRFEVKELSMNLEDNILRQRRGFSNQRTGRIEVGYNEAINLLEGEVGVTPKHELRHAMFRHYLSQGQLTPYHTKFYAAKDGRKLHSGTSYADYMSAEEIYTWSTDMQSLGQSMSGTTGAELLRHAQLMPEIIRRTDKLTVITGAAEEMAESGIKALRKMLTSGDFKSLNIGDESIELADEFGRRIVLGTGQTSSLASEAPALVAQTVLERLQNLRRIAHVQRQEALELRSMITAYEGAQDIQRGEILLAIRERMFAMAKKVKPGFEGYILNTTPP